MTNIIKGLSVKFGADTVEFDKSVTQVNKVLSTLNADLKSLNKQIKLDPKNIELLDRKFKNLNDQVRLNQDKLSIFKEDLSNLDESDLGSDKWLSLQKQISQTESNLAYLTSEAEKAENKLNEVANAPVNKLAESFKKAGEEIKSAGVSVENLGRNLVPVSAAAGAVVAGVVGISVASAQAADDLNTLSAQTSISTADLQKFKYASDIVDVSLETLASSQRKLTKAIGDGTAEQTEAFSKLGIEVRKSDGTFKSTNEVFYEVLESLSSVEDQVERDTLSMSLMGKSATDLNPIIRDGGQALKELGQEAEDLGLILEQDVLDKSNAFQDSMDKMKATSELVGGYIGSRFAPVFEKLTDTITSVIITIKELIEPMSDTQLTVVLGFAAAIATIAPILLVVGKAIQMVGTMTSGLGSILGSSMAPILAIVAAIALLTVVFTDLYNSNALFAQQVDEVFAAAGQLMSEVFSFIGEIVNTIVIPAFKAVYEIIKTFLAPIFESIMVVLRDSVIPAFSKLVQIFQEKILPIFQDIFNFINDHIVPIFIEVAETAGSIVGDAFKILGSLLEPVVDTFGLIFEIVGKVLDLLKKTGIIDGFAMAFDGLAWVLNVVLEVVEALFGGIADLIGGFGDFLGWAFGGIGDFVGDLFNDTSATFTTYSEEVQTSSRARGAGVLERKTTTYSDNDNERSKNISTYYVNIDAKNVKEFNDIVEIAQTAKQRTRMV